MFRIGILGTENSHAMAFAELFCEENGRYPDLQLAAVTGHYPEESARIAEKFPGVKVTGGPGEMLGLVDAVMVTARDGKYHAEFVEPFLRAGIPAFIDKPFTGDLAAAERLVRLAEQNGAAVCGGSSLKHAYDVLLFQNLVKTASAGTIHGGNVAAPVSLENEYGGFRFYASHLIEVFLTVFGDDPQAVTAVRSGEDVSAIVEYGRYSVTLNFTGSCYTYSASVFAKERTTRREIDLALCYRQECDVFAEMLRTGKQPYSARELILPVAVAGAIEQSYETGMRKVIPQVR